MSNFLKRLEMFSASFKKRRYTTGPPVHDRVLAINEAGSKTESRDKNLSFSAIFDFLNKKGSTWLLAICKIFQQEGKPGNQEIGSRFLRRKAKWKDKKRAFSCLLFCPGYRTTSKTRCSNSSSSQSLQFCVSSFSRTKIWSRTLNFLLDHHFFAWFA